MNTIQYLEDQAARAERLAKRITDTLTIEKLLTFAGERRREIEVIAGKYGAPDKPCTGRIRPRCEARNFCSSLASCQ